MYARIFLLAFALALAGCHDDKEALPDAAISMEVAPFRQECLSFEPERHCLYVRTEGQHLFHVLDEDIAGFEFTWGVMQRIAVGITLNENPGPDQPPVEYELEEVFLSEPVPPQYSFLLPLVRPKAALVPVDASADGSIYRLFGEIGVGCAAAVCETYEALTRDDENGVLLRMAFQTVELPQFVIVQVECAAPRENFPLDCGGRPAP